MSKGAVIGGDAAGAQPSALGLLSWKFHSHAKLQGCLAGDGDVLVTEKDNQTYKLANKQNQSLKTGQRAWSCLARRQRTQRASPRSRSENSAKTSVNAPAQMPPR